jgi:ubiquinone/menaquinone biosynthesis C-methylase UbiE
MHNDIPHHTSSRRPTLADRASAALYDPVLWLGERTGLRARREALLRQARGRTVELGAGTGLNLRLYPAGLEELILTEPDPGMRARLARRVSRSGRRAQVIDAGAQHLPFAGDSVDTIICTLVLCTVDAPDLALGEIERVLAPDGQLLFLEHVRSESPTLARWQDRLERPWRRFAQGCRCNRATAELIDSSGLELGSVTQASWRGMPPIVTPLISGRAVLGSRG